MTEAVAKLLYVVVDTICGGRGAFHCGVFCLRPFHLVSGLGGDGGRGGVIV